MLEISSKSFITWDNYDNKCRITFNGYELRFEYLVYNFIFGNYYTYNRRFEGSVKRNDTFIRPDFVDYNNSESCLRFVSYEHGTLLRYYS